jgi:hypothetical protein
MTGAAGAVAAKVALAVVMRSATATITEMATAKALAIPTCLVLLATSLILLSFLRVEVFTVRRNYCGPCCGAHRQNYLGRVPIFLEGVPR